jgi:hypothetical protein
MVVLNNPKAKATKRQLFKLRELGFDTKGMALTMQDASNKIDRAILANVEIPEFYVPEGEEPFSEAHVCIIEGEQRSGKTVTATGKVTDSYYKDCVRIYCETVLKWVKFEVKAYDRKSRVAKVKYEGKTVLFRIPTEYKLKSPMRIFSNIHLFGLPYVYIPSFRHLLYYLKKGIVRDGWLIIDEAHKGMNARAGMSTLGQELEKQGFEFGKMKLDVIIITHMARLIDWALRTIPTEHISCTYDAKRRLVTYEIRKKGERGTRSISYDPSQYWGNYWTNEKVNA